MTKRLIIVVVLLITFSCTEKDTSFKEIESAKSMVSALSEASDTLLYINYNTPAATKRLLLGTSTRRWPGGTRSNGVDSSNVWLHKTGYMIAQAKGDLSPQPRTGGIFITRQYFGYGSYRMVAKALADTGVSSAMWSFHYEEAYQGEALYNQILSEGVNPEGTTIVRNHEIDIEVPWHNDSTLSFTNYRSLNQYQTQKKVFKKMLDGQFHEFRYDWFPNKVDYYIDGVLLATSTTNIPDLKSKFRFGVWFPDTWAGVKANFTQKTMSIKSLVIIAIPGTNRVLPERDSIKIFNIK